MEILRILATLSWFSLSMVFGIIGINISPKYRPTILPGLVSCAVLAFRNVSDQSLGFEGTDTVAMFLIIYVSHIICVLYIEQYTLPKKTASIQWKAGYNILSNPRWLGTSRQAPNVHRNPKSEINCESTDEATETCLTNGSKDFRALIRSPKGIFLRNRVISLCVMIAILKISNYFSFSLFPQLGLQMEITDFLPSKETYFRRLAFVTLRESLIRAWIVSYWTISSVGIFTAIHDVVAFLFVSTGFNEPQDWPPLFGNIRDATTVRNFWAKYWHRLVYRSYTSYGKWISINVLRLPRNSVVGKMFVNFFVFAMSGTAHAIATRQLGYTCGAWEEIGFYCQGFLAVLIEGLVIKAFSTVTRGYKPGRAVSNTLGYVWVFAYLFATIPKSQYPKVWCEPA